MDFDWNMFAEGGATRSDSFTGMNPEFSSALQNFFQAAPEDIRKELKVRSGFRSPEKQKELYTAAVKKYGSEKAARKWVAPPGRSRHNHGDAADLGYVSDRAREWAHENAGAHGLSFPLSNENWHIELASARGGKVTNQTKVSDAGDPIGEVLAAGPGGDVKMMNASPMDTAIGLSDEIKAGIDALVNMPVTAGKSKGGLGEGLNDFGQGLNNLGAGLSKKGRTREVSPEQARFGPRLNFSGLI